MREGLLAEKVGMSRFYDKNKINHAVTVLQVKECQVVSLRKLDRDGYNAVTLSYGNYSKSIGKPFKEFLKKNKLKAFSHSKEFKLKEPSNFKVGDKVSVSNFLVGQFVDVTSNSIGKGFAGGMKRHNFSGNRATHGVSISHRSHGSTGQCQDPGKVFKGKKMAGHMGAANVTVQNLKVVKTASDDGYIYVKGAVPGPKGSWVLLKDSVKKSLPDDIPLPAALKNAKNEVKKDESISDDKISEENIESENNGDSNES